MERALTLEAKIKIYFKDYKDELDKDFMTLAN
jgi:hypothetical protein